MGYALKCNFDQDSAKAISAIWQALADAGLASFLLDSGSKPGITLCVWENAKEEDLVALLKKFAQTAKDLPLVQMSGVDHFPTDPASVYLQAIPSPPLLALHKFFHDLNPELSKTGIDYYQPKQWIPHSTLALRCPLASVPKIIDTCLEFKTTLQAKITSVTLLETGTARVVAELPMRIDVVEYDPQWAQTFVQLKNHISSHLGDVPFAIEHVGSTSVEGLAAKPVIDMDIFVENKSVALEAIQALAKIGYIHLGDQGVPGREAFRRPENSPKHNLYVCLKGCVALRNHILLRDALRNNSEMKSAYGKLKFELAEKFAGNIDGYCEAKTEFILHILKQQGLSESDLAEVADANADR